MLSTALIRTRLLLLRQIPVQAGAINSFWSSSNIRTSQINDDLKLQKRKLHTVRQPAGFENSPSQHHLNAISATPKIIVASSLRTEIAKPSQLKAITDFLVEYFRVDEPISRSINLNKDDAKIFFEKSVAHGLKKPVSFLVSNQRGEIVACLLNDIVDIEPLHKTNACETDPPAVKKIVDFLNIISKDIEKVFPSGTKRIMKHLFASVHPDYQRLGLAIDLMEKCEKVAIDYQCDYLCTEATAMRSQALLEKKMGFKPVRVIPHTEFRDPVTKRQIFQCDDGTNCGKLMVKKLR